MQKLVLLSLNLYLNKELHFRFCFEYGSVIFWSAFQNKCHRVLHYTYNIYLKYLNTAYLTVKTLKYSSSISLCNRAELELCFVANTAGKSRETARIYQHIIIGHKVVKSLTLTFLLKGNFKSLERLNNVSLGTNHTPTPTHTHSRESK